MMAKITPYGTMITFDESDEGTPKMIQEMFKPEKMMQQGKATIFFWKDGTKTVVKLQEGDSGDIHDAFAVAIAKKMFGSRTALKKVMEDMLEIPTVKKGDSNEAIPTSAGCLRKN